VFVSGDFCPANLTMDWLAKGTEAKAIFGDFYQLIQGTDFSITNLECPLTLHDQRIKKIGPNLKAHPEMVSVLKEVGFDIVTLANNHIYDFGQQGLSDTLNSLRQNNIRYVGAGLTLHEAQRPLFIEIKNTTLGIVNFAEVEYSGANSSEGGSNPMHLIDNFHQIQAARSNCDHVLVIVHGGHEHYHYPSPETLKRYRFYADSGASAVIAHHTHCIGGYERYNDVPIFYSLGNFFFPTDIKMPPFWHEGYALLLKIAKKSLEFDILPYEQCKNGDLSIDRIRGNEILAKIEGINRVLNDDEQLAAYWKKFTKNRTDYYLSMMSGIGRYKIAIFRRLGLLGLFYRKPQLEFLRQMIRCEAHKEVAHQVLSNYLK